MRATWNGVIVATNPTVEGEATATYLSHQLKRAGVKVTHCSVNTRRQRIQYTDEITMLKAMEGRPEL
jgi:recombination protein RecR